MLFDGGRVTMAMVNSLDVWKTLGLIVGATFLLTLGIEYVQCAASTARAVPVVQSKTRPSVARLA